MKLCIECRHFLPAADPKDNARWGKCRASIDKPAHRSPVDGRDNEPTYFYAEIARYSSQPCGPEGKLFEAKA